MSNFFKDSVHEEMDFLTAAVRPMIFSINNIYTEMPESIDIELNELSNTQASEMALTMAINMFDMDPLTRSLFGYIKHGFKFQVEKGTYIDGENNELIGSVKLIKNEPTLSEEHMTTILASFVYNTIITTTSKTGKTGIKDYVKRCKEISRIFGIKIKTTSAENATFELRQTIINMDWNIRDLDLKVKLIHWIKRYIDYGCLHSMANISKFKCMTHKGQPIYSMEEIK